MTVFPKAFRALVVDDSRGHAADYSRISTEK